LDLFEGKLSIDDIHNTELPTLLSLEKQKVKKNEVMARKMENAMQAPSNQKTITNR